MTPTPPQPAELDAQTKAYLAIGEAQAIWQKAQEQAPPGYQVERVVPTAQGWEAYYVPWTPSREYSLSEIHTGKELTPLEFAGMTVSELAFRSWWDPSYREWLASKQTVKTPEEKAFTQRIASEQVTTAVNVALIGYTLGSFAYMGSKLAYYRFKPAVSERIPKSWKVSYETYVKEPASFYKEYFKEQVSGLPVIGTRYHVGREPYVIPKSLKEWEIAYKANEKLGFRQLRELETETKWLRPSEARFMEAQALLTKPTKIVGAGTEWRYVFMPTEQYRSLTFGKQIEKTYKPSDIYSLLEAKGGKQVFSFVAGTEPIKGQAGRFIFRDITAFQMYGKPLKGYAEVFGYPQVFGAPKGPTAFTAISQLPKETPFQVQQRLYEPWKTPLTSAEKTTNAILRELGQQIPDEMAFKPRWWVHGQAQLTDYAGLTTLKLPTYLAPKVVSVPKTSQLFLPVILRPTIAELTLPLVTKRVVSTGKKVVSKVGVSTYPFYEPTVSTAPATTFKMITDVIQGVGILPQTLVSRKTGVPVPSIPPTTPSRLLTSPRIPLGGGAGRGVGGKRIYGRWFKKTQAIKTPEEMIETFLGKG